MGKNLYATEATKAAAKFSNKQNIETLPTRSTMVREFFNAFHC